MKTANFILGLIYACLAVIGLYSVTITEAPLQAAAIGGFAFISLFGYGVNKSIQTTLQ